MPLTVAQLVARLTADTSGFYRSMAIANSSMLRTGGIIGRVAAGAGLAVLGMGIVSLRAAGNFQQSMNILQAVTNGTTQEMKSLSGQAIALGRDFKLPNVSAKDAADAMVELSKGGLSVNRVLTATRGTLQLGLAANIDFGEAAQFTARSLKAFGLQGKDAGRVANVLAAAANKSTAEFSDLTFGFQNAASQFKATNMSVEDLAASLAIMADHGIAGEQAGTALKTMLIRLTSPTDKAAAVMKKYGLGVFDAAGNMKTMPQIIGTFQRGLHGLTMEQREQALTTLFGVRANSAMRTLLLGGEAGYLKYRDAITGTNAAQKLAEARTKGFNGAIQAVGSAAETLAIQLGTALLPAATRLTRGLANFIASIDPNKIIAFFSAIANGVRTVNDFIQAHTWAKAVVLGFLAALAGFFIIGAITSLVMGLVGAVIALGVALLANPIVLVAAALIGLGVAFLYAYRHSEEFRNVVNGVFSWLKTAALGILNYVKAVWAQWGSVFVGAFLPVVVIVRQNWNNIKTIFEAAWTAIRAITTSALNLVKTIIETQFNIVRGIVHTFLALLKGDWQGVWDGIKETVRAVLVGIIAIIRASLSLSITVVKSLARLIGVALWEGIKAGASSLAALGGWLIGKITGAIGSVASWAYGAATSIGSAIASGILGGIGDLASSLASKVKGAVGSALGSVKGAFGIGSPSKVFADQVGKPIGEGIIVGFLLGVADLPNKVKKSLENALEAGKKVVQARLSEMKTQFEQFAQDVLSAFDKITQTHLTPAEKQLAEMERKKKEAQINDDLTAATDRLAAAQRALRDAQAGVVPLEDQEKLNKLFRERDDAIDNLAQKQAKLRELDARGIDHESSEWLAAVQAEDDAKQKILDFNQQIVDMRAQIAKDGAQRIIDAEQELDAAQDALEEAKYNKQVYNLERIAAEERKQYDARREQQRRNLEGQLIDLEAYLELHPEAWRKVNRKILALLRTFGVGFKASGAAMGRAFARGMISELDNIERAAKEIAAIIEKYLKVKSPTEKGPMSDLDHWFDDFAPTLLRGLDVGHIQDTLSSLVAPDGMYASMATLGRAPGTLPDASMSVLNAGTPVIIQLDSREIARGIINPLRDEAQTIKARTGRPAF